MQKQALSALTLALALCLLQTYAVAEDTAHGGADNTADSTETIQPGEAVKATRTSERYTEQGVTTNPVAIDIAPNGDIYVAEGSRAGEAVLDNRKAALRKTNGVENDLRKTSVEDRLDQINMLIEKGLYPADHFTKTDEQVRLIRDTDGDGKADAASVFADGFNEPLDGIASGVLFHNGKVYLTNIPHLWLLEDKDGDGDADKTTEGERVSLSYGWGIRWAFFGHDMHGLIKGPDGRIYFSIGDRGYNVTTKEGKQLYGPDRGAVFRMWPDGSGLELFFEGLRNPQELAFDNYGNLFTGDNNSDSGDKARFVYLPEGGDSGWRQDVQSLKDRGPWNREFMWHPRKPKDDLSQPAWIIPPLKNVGRGPSGLAHYPGTGDIYADNGSFLMCDYPVGVRHVQVKPDGATFKVVDDSALISGQTITDIAWGYDGKLYLSDWGGGYNPNNRGHLKTMVNEAAHKSQAKQIAEVKQLFAEGFDKLSDEKLIKLLGHADQRVRIHAQWEAATRDSNAINDGLVFEWLGSKNELSRLHALWALGMTERQNEGKYRGAIIYEYFEQPDAYENPKLVAQAMSVLGELGYKPGKIQYQNSLKSDHAAERYHGAIALGKTGNADDIPLLLDLLGRNNNDDVAIRHAASYGLSLIGDANAIAAEARPKGAAARLGAVLALRRLHSPLLADFLADDDPMVAAEAARAIYDKRVMDAMPALAALSDTIPLDRMSEPVMRRVIEANVRLADQASAMRLGKLAANTTSPEAWRLLALSELDGWANERNREGVWGSWWPRPEQTMDPSKAAMMTHLPGVVGDKNGKIATQARTLIQKHIKKSSPAELAEAALNPIEPEALRLGSLAMLVDADRALATETTKQLIASEGASATMRIEARFLLASLDHEASQLAYAQAIESGALIEQQDAIERLGSGAAANGKIPGSTFIKLTDALNRGELDPTLKLDVLQAVTNNQAMPAPVRVAVQQYVEQNQTAAEKPFIRDASLAGGSIERGKEIFLHHPGATCTQCHRLDNEESQGPNLSGIGAVRDLDYLYTAVVLPNADIVPGYINENNQSNMKPMHEVLSPHELRDVLAYLASLKSDPSPYYLKLANGSGHSSELQVARAAGDLKHAIWLPSILLGITAVLFALLMLTVLGGQMAKP